MKYRELSEKEEADLRALARKNFKVGQNIEPYWHPVYRDECNDMIEESEISARCAKENFIQHLSDADNQLPFMKLTQSNRHNINSLLQSIRNHLN